LMTAFGLARAGACGSEGGQPPETYSYYRITPTALNFASLPSP
jgi:hypothetical protein